MKRREGIVLDISVIFVTYNHAEFIDQALESVIGQQVDADVEILVSEDVSTDGTREKVIEYARRYPDLIRLFLSDHNQNDRDVYLRALQAARGEFIAYIDGDDYWLPGKLQKQLDHLRSHPDSPMCYHDVEIVRVDGGTPIGRYGPFRDVRELLVTNPVPSGAMRVMSRPR